MPAKPTAKRTRSQVKAQVKPAGKPVQTEAPTLSVVLGTLQRVDYLRAALASVIQPEVIGKLSFEIVVVDGGSTDGTLEFLHKFKAWLEGDPMKDARGRSQGSVKIIAQGERLGAVKAFTAGFQAAGGEFVAAINDDVKCIGPLFVDAVRMLQSDPTIGQVALPYGRAGQTPSYENVRIPELGEVLYANFGVIRRSLGNECGWWSDYFQYGGDTELSVKVWFKGLRVVPLRLYAPGQKLQPHDPVLIHYLVDDSTRVPNVEQQVFNARWRRNANQPRANQTELDRSREQFRVLAERITGLNAPAFPRTMKEGVLLRYLGGGAGSQPFTPPHSTYKYLVSENAPLVWVESQHLEWFLGLHKPGGGSTFVRVEIEGTSGEDAKSG